MKLFVAYLVPDQFGTLTKINTGEIDCGHINSLDDVNVVQEAIAKASGVAKVVLISWQRYDQVPLSECVDMLSARR